ncbi:hypothetical protein Rhal01_01342 [Rubritalea halochordaticola]|uniref:Uncharacterized protein n=1 Tax=Rubritalea halochordaticola TaxID=714537 RepID=A0ABP9V0N8_9BACT
MKKLFGVCLFLLCSISTFGEELAIRGINDVVAEIIEGGELVYIRHRKLDGVVVRYKWKNYANDEERIAAVSKLAGEHGLETYLKGRICYILSQDQMRQLPFHKIYMRFHGKRGMTVEKFQEEIRAAFKDDRSNVKYDSDTGLVELYHRDDTTDSVGAILERYLKVREFKSETELFNGTQRDSRLFKEDIRVSDMSLNKVLSLLAENSGVKYEPRDSFEGANYELTGVIQAGKDPLRMMDDVAFQFGLTLFVRDNECHFFTVEELNKMKHLKREWKLTAMNDEDIRKVIEKLNSEVLTTIDGKAEYMDTGCISLSGRKEQLDKAVQVLLEADNFK